MVFVKVVLLMQHAIITLVDRITKSQDMGDRVIAILIDLKKAFDTVGHKILLRKLYTYGIRGNMLKWFESYLSHRTQYVVFGGEKPDTNSIRCGVPQGSILGPLLFILSVNVMYLHYFSRFYSLIDTCVKRQEFENSDCSYEYRAHFLK